MLWKLPRWKKGDVITAEKLNHLIEAIERATINVSQGMGIDVQQGMGGTTLRWVDPLNRYLGVASGNITVRSGSTPGTGTVTLYTYDPTSNLSSLSINVSVLNASSTTMTSGNGIDSGQYCWVEQDANGFWWVSPLECS